MLPSKWAPNSKVTAHFPALIGFAFINERSIAGVPFVAEGKISAEVSASIDSKWGESTSTTKTWSMEVSMRADPGTVMGATVTLKQGKMEVPYTIRLRSKSSGHTGEKKGIWRGVSNWDIRVDYKEVKQPT